MSLPTAKKRLLFVITQGGPWGGAQRYVFDLATSLTDRFDVTVAIGEPHGSPDLQNALHERQIPVRQLAHLKRNISPLQDLLAVLELVRLYREIQPDIIHLNSTKTSILGAIAARIMPQSSRPRVIYTAHGWVFEEPIGRLRQSLYRFCERVTAPWKDTVIVLSNVDKKIATDALRIAPEKLRVIPIGVNVAPSPWTKADARRQVAAECNTSFGAGDYFIGTIANFYKTKGLVGLIESFASVATTSGTSHLVLIGDGPERGAIENAVAAFGLTSRVHLLGFKKNATDYLPAFDLFVLASLKEGMPYVIQEALANRLPIVATAVGAIPELLEKKQNVSLLVPPHDVPSLCKAIRDMQSRPLAQQNNTAPDSNSTLAAMIRNTISSYESLG